MRPRYRPDYAMPGIDSPRALASAQLFLTSARSLDGVTAETIAYRYRLSPKRAEYELALAMQNRVRTPDFEGGEDNARA